MRLRDLYEMARENLMRRKLRTGLTVLSIVIGTISIILMIALGNSMQESVRKEFDSYGSINVLEVSKEVTDNKASRYYEKNSVNGLTDQDVQNLKDIEGVEITAPIISTGVSIYTNHYYNDVQLVGFDPFLMESMGFNTKVGRLLKDNIHFEAVFGDKALEQFKKIPSDNPNATIQRPEDSKKEINNEEMTITLGGEPVEETEYPFYPMEERYKLGLYSSEEKFNGTENNAKLYSLNCVGILKEGDMMKDYNVYVPLEVLEKILKSNYESQGIPYKRSYSQIMVKVKNMNQIKAVKSAIEAKGYSVFSLMSILESVTKTMDTLKIALGAIGGIALFVAAIGITNTMVMAITERKKEIGVMKVIGATIVDIKRLFLLEAALIGMIGGVVGLTLCILISKFLSSDYFTENVLKQSPGSGISLTIPFSLIIGGIIFTTIIGIASGYLPALKAMKSSALEAIRNE